MADQVWQHRTRNTAGVPAVKLMEKLMGFQRIRNAGRAGALAAATLAAGAVQIGGALAHPGHEGPSGALHFVASPFHAVLLAGAVIGGIALSVAARRSVARRKQAEARKR